MTRAQTAVCTAVSPMSRSPTFDIDKKNRNGANLRLRHALRADGVIITYIFQLLISYNDNCFTPNKMRNMLELNTDKEGFMAYTAPEDAQRPRTVYAINPNFRGI